MNRRQFIKSTAAAIVAGPSALIAGNQLSASEIKKRMMLKAPVGYSAFQAKLGRGSTVTLNKIVWDKLIHGEAFVAGGYYMIDPSRVELVKHG